MSPVVRRVLVALFSFILLVQATPTPHSAIKHHLLNPSKRDTVANHFIARYHDNVTDEAIERHRRLLEGVLETRRRSPSLGFTPRIDMIQIGDMRALDLRVDHDMIPVIAQAPEIRYVEQSVTKTAGAIDCSPTLQQNGDYGLGRLSHTGTGFQKYAHNTPSGVGIYVYVVDSGINVLHEEFGGTQSRAWWGYNAINNNDVDGYGHGTHVAGVIGSQTYGVAKNVTLIAVKVLDEAGAGTTNSLVSGLHWIIQDVKNNQRMGKAVINVSLEGSYVQAENDAVTAAVNAGITVVAAAGNEGNNASTNSPGSADGAICVGAIDPKNDTMALWSAYGERVDIQAPGTNVVSTWYTSPTATMTMSGTSMAAPYIAGLAAYLMAKEDITNATDVKNGITDLAQQAISHGARPALWQRSNVLGDPGSTNLIAWNGECSSASLPGCF